VRLFIDVGTNSEIVLALPPDSSLRGSCSLPSRPRSGADCAPRRAIEGVKIVDGEVELHDRDVTPAGLALGWWTGSPNCSPPAARPFRPVRARASERFGKIARKRLSPHG